MEEAPHSCQARRHPAGSQALLCQAATGPEAPTPGGRGRQQTWRPSPRQARRGNGRGEPTRRHPVRPTSGPARGGGARPGVGGRPGRLREHGATGGWGTGPGERTLPIYPVAKSVGDVSLACGRSSAHTGVASHILLLRPTQLSRGSTAGPPSHTGLSIHCTGLALPTPNLCCFPEPSSGLPGPGEGTGHCWAQQPPHAGAQT